MRYHLDVNVIALLSQGRQSLKMPVQPPQTLLEWLTNIHIPVPNNILSCYYLQTASLALMEFVSCLLAETREAA